MTCPCDDACLVKSYSASSSYSTMATKGLEQLLGEKYNSTRTHFLQAVDVNQRTQTLFASDVELLLRILKLQDAAIAYLKLNVLNRVTSVPVIVEHVVDRFLNDTFDQIQIQLLYGVKVKVKIKVLVLSLDLKLILTTLQF